jgi:hypothetical protein
MSDLDLGMPPVPEKMLGSHGRRMEYLLQHYAKGGHTLAYISGKKILRRSVKTLRGYCARYSIAFPDWVPRHMREKKPRAPRKSRAKIKTEGAADVT